MIRSGNGDRCQPIPIPDGGGDYVKWLWDLRSFCNGADDPIKPALIRDWADSVGVSLYRHDAVILYAMDRAFRREYPKTIARYDAIRAKNKR